MQSSLTKVALVDDHVLLRSGLVGLVNSIDGFEVTLEADHGQDFIRQIPLKGVPDIVLLDITMPVMNGYETAEWIRSHYPDMRVIVLSMMDHDEAIIRMLRYGAKGYLLKDSKPQTFRQALQHVRDHGFYLNEMVSSRMLHFMNQDSDKQDPGFAGGIKLTDREITFLKLSCSEKTYKEIADDMHVSVRTVETYRDNLFDKLGLNTRVGLVLFAIKNGIVTI